jgi:hypothetical protein
MAAAEPLVGPCGVSAALAHLPSAEEESSSPSHHSSHLAAPSPAIPQQSTPAITYWHPLPFSAVPWQGPASKPGVDIDSGLWLLLGVGLA